jgi:hypothetical protein
VPAQDYLRDAPAELLGDLGQDRVAPIERVRPSLLNSSITFQVETKSPS